MVFDFFLFFFLMLIYTSSSKNGYDFKFCDEK